MALEELLDALEAEAAVELERLHADARGEGERIVATARHEARALEEHARLASEDELLREVERRRAAARLAATAHVRQAREECIHSLLHRLRERLETLPETDAYPALLRALLEEALAALPSATLVRVTARDRSLVAESLAQLGRGARVEAGLDTVGGVEVADGEGRTARNTFEERLRNATPELRLLFAALLDEERRPAPPAAARGARR